MIARRALYGAVCILVALVTAACGDAAPDAGGSDPSKLSAELEEDAQAIEERAAAAVRAAEVAADADLAQLNAEAMAESQNQRGGAAATIENATTSTN